MFHIKCFKLFSSILVYIHQHNFFKVIQLCKLKVIQDSINKNFENKFQEMEEIFFSFFK